MSFIVTGYDAMSRPYFAEFSSDMVSRGCAKFGLNELYLMAPPAS